MRGRRGDLCAPSQRYRLVHVALRQVLMGTAERLPFHFPLDELDRAVQPGTGGQVVAERGQRSLGSWCIRPGRVSARDGCRGGRAAPEPRRPGRTIPWPRPRPPGRPGPRPCSSRRPPSAVTIPPAAPSIPTISRSAACSTRPWAIVTRRICTFRNPSLGCSVAWGSASVACAASPMAEHRQDSGSGSLNHGPAHAKRPNATWDMRPNNPCSNNCDRRQAGTASTDGCRLERGLRKCVPERRNRCSDRSSGSAGGCWFRPTAAGELTTSVDCVRTSP